MSEENKFKGVIYEIQREYALHGKNYVDIYEGDYLLYENLRYEFDTGKEEGEFTVDNYDDPNITLAYTFNEKDIINIQSYKKYKDKKYDVIIRLKNKVRICIWNTYEIKNYYGY